MQLRHVLQLFPPGCLLSGSCVIVPVAGHNTVLHQLHEAHPGIAQLKMIASLYVWWPGRDSDIKNKSASLQYLTV